MAFINAAPDGGALQVGKRCVKISLLAVALMALLLIVFPIYYGEESLLNDLIEYVVDTLESILVFISLVSVLDSPFPACNP